MFDHDEAFPAKLETGLDRDRKRPARARDLDEDQDECSIRSEEHWQGKQQVQGQGQ